MKVCFTGHRPGKLGTGYSITNDRVVAYSNLLAGKIIPLIQQGADTFISGGAIGIDQIAFWTVHSLKRQFPHIKNILAIPFQKQYTAWKNDEIVSWYHKMIQCADEVVYVDSISEYQDASVPIGDYTAYKMELRNRYMVDNADIVIAVWNGTSGGTSNCVRYAKSMNKQVIQLQPLHF